MPTNPRRGTREYKRQQKASPSQDPLIKAHMMRARMASSKFEAAEHEMAAKATARLDNTMRRMRRERQSTDSSNGY